MSSYLQGSLDTACKQENMFPHLRRLVREKLAKVSRKHDRIKVKIVEGSLLFVPTSKSQSIDEFSLLIFLAQQPFCNFLHKGTYHGEI